FQPRIAAARTEKQYGLLVEELVARLEDSHAVVTRGSAQPPAPELPQWDPGLTCLTDDRGRPTVYAVDPGSPAAKAGVRPGLTIVSVDETPADELVRKTMHQFKTYFGFSSERVLRYDAVRAFLRQSTRGQRLTVALEDPEGKFTTV